MSQQEKNHASILYISLIPGTSDSSATIAQLYMDSNKLSVLEAGSIAFYPETDTVDLRNSQIQDIQPQAIKLLEEQRKWNLSN